MTLIGHWSFFLKPQVSSLAPRNEPGRGFLLPRPVDVVKDLRQIATDGVAGRVAIFWRATAPAVGEEGHPGKVGPSVGINLPKVVSLSVCSMSVTQ
jgi:hypothetical protein